MEPILEIRGLYKSSMVLPSKISIWHEQDI